MILESYADIQRFQSENIEGDWFVHAIADSDRKHPASCILANVIFIRNIQTKKTYVYTLHHPDAKCPTRVHSDIFGACMGKIWALDAKAFTQMYPMIKPYDANVCSYFAKNEIFELVEYETQAHKMIYRNSNGFEKENFAVPLLKHIEMFDELADDMCRVIKKFTVDNSFLLFNELIHVLGEVETTGLCVDPVLFEKYFKVKPHHNSVYSQYNVYTSTGRPGNSFGGINYAALKHEDGSRSCFVSRYGNDGRMVAVDYSAFHPRIICNLTNYPIAGDVDIYEYLAKLYFQKKEVDETDISNAKKLTFRQFYGGVEDKYSHIKYLANLKSYIDTQWEFFKKNNYVETPMFKRKITDSHIQDPNPTKVFNYLLQAVEGEIAIPKLGTVLKYLKNKRTRAVLYTYDAVLYDFHKDDGIETLNNIRQIMSCTGMFPMKTYIGKSYNDVKLVEI